MAVRDVMKLGLICVVGVDCAYARLTFIDHFGLAERGNKCFVSGKQNS